LVVLEITLTKQQQSARVPVTKKIRGNVLRSGAEGTRLNVKPKSVNFHGTKTPTSKSSLKEFVKPVDELKVAVLVVEDFRDLLVTSENVVLCLKTKKYRYYYDIIMGHNFLLYFVYYRPLNAKKITGWVGLDKKNELLVSEVPKLGHKKIIQLKWDSVALKVFQELLK